MATPEWPVPYYQRAYRHPVSLGKNCFDFIEKNTGDLSCIGENIHDIHVIFAKEMLKAQGEGAVVEAIENHFDIDNYTTQFETSLAFSKAYVDDLLEALPVAWKQNARILNLTDLADVMRD